MATAQEARGSAPRLRTWRDGAVCQRVYESMMT